MSPPKKALIISGAGFAADGMTIIWRQKSRKGIVWAIIAPMLL